MLPEPADTPCPAPSRPPRDVAHEAALEAMTELLREDARAWARKVQTLVVLDDLVALGVKAGQAQYPQLEMAGSWNISQITADRWQQDALRLTIALPRTLAMLATGALLEHQAKVLLHRTRHCTEAVARQVEAQVLPAGAELYPSDLAKQVDRAVLRIESEQAAAAAEQRHADAAAQRRTFSRPLPDGMALTGAVLTAQQQAAFTAGLDTLELQQRQADRDAGVDRTAEQRRADLFAALPAMVLAGTTQNTDPATDPATDPDTAGRPWRGWLLGPEQLCAQVVLHVHVPVATVLDLSREPGSIDRYGPISAEHVRLLRPTSLRRVMVDDQTGQPLAVDDRTTPAATDPAGLREQIQQMLRPAVITDIDEPQHDPSARLSRLVDLRDKHCCGPGCSSSRTERDHLDPWPTGPTSARNLKRESPRCHHAKHHGWTLTAHPDGSATWTSPLTRGYWRPAPHNPPPRADLWQEPPPLRNRPTGRTTNDEHDEHDDPPRPPLPTGVPQAVPGTTGNAATPDSHNDTPDSGAAAHNDDPPPF